MPPEPAELLASLDAIHGVHEGRRAAHAKGTLCAGRFTASPQAAALTTAAHMQGEPVRVTVRFSNGSGDPGAPDTHRLEGRGMATKFYLPDNTTTDIVALTIPVFFVRTAEDFLGFTTARRPDPETGQPDMAALGAFLAAHPETQQALALILPTFQAPESYARVAYNSLHAFVMVDADGNRRAGRYRSEPEAGVRLLAEEEADARDPDYLQDEIAERVTGAGAAFRLIFILAEEGDPLDDPTAAWPEDRERVELGRLELDGLDTTRERDGDVLVFDPTRVTDGIECSDDEILHVRSKVYELSVLRRSGVRRQ